MSPKYYKGDKLIGTHLDTNTQYEFTCPKDGMCSKMLALYVVMRLNKPVGKYIFVKQ